MERKGEKEKMMLPTQIEKEEAAKTKILGVWIDKEMKWKKQVGEKCAKGRRVGGLIRRLGRGGRGIGFENLRTMYLATARATIEYGSAAWWKGQKGYAGRIDKVNENSLRKIGGHFETAPGAAVLLEARAQLTAVRLDSKNRRRAIAALTTDTSSPEARLAENLIMNLDPEAEECKPGKTWKERKKKGMQKAIEKIRGIVKEKWSKVEKWERSKVEGWERRMLRENEGREFVKWSIEVERKQRERLEKEGEVHVYVDGA